MNVLKCVCIGNENAYSNLAQYVQLGLLTGVLKKFIVPQIINDTSQELNTIIDLLHKQRKLKEQKNNFWVMRFSQTVERLQYLT